MTKIKFQNKYRIPSARAGWHDYNGEMYFITICTAGMEHYFGKIKDGVMCLNELGNKLNQIIIDIPTHNKYAEITLYQIMPNHLHLIVLIDNRLDALGAIADEIDMNVVDDGSHIADNSIGADSSVGRDVACRVSTGTPGTPETTENSQNHIKNEKMQLIAEKCGLLSIAIGGMKSATTRYANDNNITFGWQERFHDHIIRNQEEYNRIAEYIENNPAIWEQDKFYTGETTVDN